MANSRFLKNLELAMRGTRTISVDSLMVVMGIFQKLIMLCDVPYAFGLESE